MFPVPRVDLFHALLHADGCRHGFRRVGGPPGGRAENDQHAVAQKLNERAVLAFDLFVHLAEIMVDHGDEVLGGHPLRQGGKAPQVAHHHRERLPLPAQLPAAGRIQDLFHHVIRQIAAEGLLQDPVPQFQFAVELLDPLHGPNGVPHFRQFRDVADHKDHADHLPPLMEAGRDDAQLLDALGRAIRHIALPPRAFLIHGVKNALDEFIVLLTVKKGADKGAAHEALFFFFKNAQGRVVGKLDHAVKADGHNALGHVGDDAALNDLISFHILCSVQIWLPFLLERKPYLPLTAGPIIEVRILDDRPVIGLICRAHRMVVKSDVILDLLQQ